MHRFTRTETSGVEVSEGMLQCTNGDSEFLKTVATDGRYADLQVQTGKKGSVVIMEARKEGQKSTTGLEQS